MNMPGAWPEDDIVEVDLEVDNKHLVVGAYGTAPPHMRKPISTCSRRLKTSLNTRGSVEASQTKETPTGRPLPEPPMFNYDDFVRREAIHATFSRQEAAR